MIEKHEIRQLMNRYSLAIDLTDPEAYASVFTDDGELVLAGEMVIAKGREALMAQAQSDKERFNPGAKDGTRSFMVMRSVLTNPVVTLTGEDSATGISYIQIVVDQEGVGPVILSQGRYEDEYRKVDGNWLIARRSLFTTDMANFEVAQDLGLLGP